MHYTFKIVCEADSGTCIGLCVTVGLAVLRLKTFKANRIVQPNVKREQFGLKLKAVAQAEMLFSL